MVPDLEDANRPSNAGLKARVNIDIKPDENGDVFPNIGGLSTFTDPHKMPPMWRHKSLGGLCDVPIFKIDGTFIQSDLQCRPQNESKKHHVFIEPSDKMAFTTYTNQLYATKSFWDLYCS
ncbi:hypothetical protein [Leptospira interrogans]|uniref:hypothetical protein n=1 Tax=Leptospira interrogans TaxID=173 RepID=UPI0007743D0A